MHIITFFLYHDSVKWKKRKAKGMDKFLKFFNQESIVAAGRDQRPFIATNDIGCPFCPQNNEALEEVISETYDNGKLMAKIVANKYPIASRKADQCAYGIHDVIIDTDQHGRRPKDFSVRHWQLFLSTVQKRWLDLMLDPKLHFIQVFKNDGSQAGASISHSHWQLLALEEIPHKMTQQYAQYKKQQSCFLCEAVNYGEGFLILENTYWRMWVPPVPEFMGEVWLIPKRHLSHFGKLNEEELLQLGKLIKSVLTAYDKIKPGVSYNICFISGDIKEKWDFHFYIRIMMRIGHIAGFEIATGSHILTLSPEEYAKALYLNIKGMYE